MTTKPNARSVVRAAVNKLRVEDGDVILIKANSRMAQKGNFEAFASYLGKTGRGKCVVCVVEEFDDLTVLDAEAMRRQGWARIHDEEE